MFDRHHFRALISSTVESAIQSPNPVTEYELDEINKYIPSDIEETCEVKTLSERMSPVYLGSALTCAVVIPILFYLTSEGTMSGGGYSASITALVTLLSVLPLVVYLILQSSRHISATKCVESLKFLPNTRESKLAKEALELQDHPKFPALMSALLYQQKYRMEYQKVSDADKWDTGEMIERSFGQCVDLVVEMLLDQEEQVITGQLTTRDSWILPESVKQASIISAEVASSKILMEPN